MAAKGDQGTVRALNRRLLLRLMRERGPSSRAELADLSGLSGGAVTRIVGELIDERLLVEQSIGVSTGGRRPVLLDLDTAARVVVGIKLMDDAIIAVLVDLKGTVVAERRIPLRVHGVGAVLARAATAVDELLAKAKVSRDRLGGVGLCMPGAIDWRSGVCLVSPYFGWRDVPVADLLSARLGVPVAVDNDVNALAVTETLFGRGQGARDMVVITLGRGVGAGLAFGGSVYRGHGGVAGEFGHVVSEPDGRRCECGKSGCLEAYIGEPALLTRVRELGPAFRNAGIHDFLASVDDGDPAASALHADVTRRLGIAVANLTNVVNPELVLLGGEAAYLNERFVEEVRRHVVANVFAGLVDDLRVELDDWRSDRTAWARGAASLAMERVFDPFVPNVGAAIA